MATAQVDSTQGAMFIGLIVASVLYGASSMQVWYYFDNYPNDPRFLRYSVIAAWVCDTAHQALISHVVYSYNISHFGDVENLKLVVWSLYIEVIFNALTGFIVQVFFIYRIWMFKKQPIVVGFIGVMVFALLGSALAYVGKGMYLPTFDDLTKIKPLSMTVNILTAVSDLAISASMVNILSGSKTGFSWSDHIVNRLILFSINTGLLTSACACLSLIFILAMPTTLIYFCFYFTIGRLYCNSFMATLNARKSIRERASNGRNDETISSIKITGGHGMQLGRLRSALGSRGGTSDSHHPTQVGIHVQVETQLHGDDMLSPDNESEGKHHSIGSVHDRPTKDKVQVVAL